MKNKKYLFLLFLAVVAAQLYVPTQMILDQEDVLQTGTPFRFETEPVDPTDPMRGKYIRLRFKENKFQIEDVENWERNEKIYVVIKNTSNSYAKIVNVVKEKPSANTPYIKAKVDQVYDYNEDDKHIQIEYPFTRFYMEESKAKEAENLAQRNPNTNKKTYALVYVKNGKSVLNNVFVNNKPIKKVVEENRE